ncbi:hypothetical protein DNTS_022138 [Danionella cerebrum]|uniref:Phosphoinositide-interacting protein n=1 Tax=Danionella cerebrum TaxID=2873325 RepID=A0A553R0P1_9TELE|nr:hypothetical protein DNTS_022138 [Danionella translucida]
MSHGFLSGGYRIIIFDGSCSRDHLLLLSINKERTDKGKQNISYHYSGQTDSSGCSTKDLGPRELTKTLRLQFRKHRMVAASAPSGDQNEKSRGADSSDGYDTFQEESPDPTLVCQGVVLWKQTQQLLKPGCVRSIATTCQAGLTMPSAPNSPPLPLRDTSRSCSREHLTPRSENTIFNLSHHEGPWRPVPLPGSCEFYWQAILLMSLGGSVLLCGLVLCGLYFAGVSVTATNILAPALLSLGLMVLVIGGVLMPIMRESRKHSATKHLCSFYSPQLNL